MAVGIEDFEADDAALCVVVEHDALGHLLALDDRGVREAQVGRVGVLVIGEGGGHRVLHRTTVVPHVSPEHGANTGGRRVHDAGPQFRTTVVMR